MDPFFEMLTSRVEPLPGRTAGTSEARPASNPNTDH